MLRQVTVDFRVLLNKQETIPMKTSPIVNGDFGNLDIRCVYPLIYGLNYTKISITSRPNVIKK